MRLRVGGRTREVQAVELDLMHIFDGAGTSLSIKSTTAMTLTVKYESSNLLSTKDWMLRYSC
jgi:hypothetical protein